MRGRTERAGFAALVLSGAALFVSGLSLERTRKRSRAAERFRRDAELVRRRERFVDDLWRWAGSVVDALSDAVVLCHYDPERPSAVSFFDRRQELRARLSALIDRGRWLFPNALPDPVPDELDGRGVLDPIVLAYRNVRSLNYRAQVETRDGATRSNFAVKDDLVENKRAFVAAMTAMLSPRHAGADEVGGPDRSHGSGPPLG